MSGGEKERISHGNLVALVVAILGAFGGGFGSNYLWIRANPESITEVVRPDPFTGSQGRALERRIDIISASLDELRRRVDRIPPEELGQRLVVIEHEVGELGKYVHRLQDSFIEHKHFD